MLDKVYYKSRFEIILIMTHKEPFTIYDSGGRAYELFLWLTTTTKLTFPEFLIALKNEDTVAA